MSELDRHLRESVRADSAANHARAPRKVRRDIVRSRALRIGAISTAVVVAIGTAAAGALELTDRSQSTEPQPSPDLTLDTAPRELVTVALPNTNHIYRGMDSTGAPLCGGPAPEPNRSSEDFSATFDLPAQLDLERGSSPGTDNSPRATISLTYDEAEDLPAFADSLTALFIQNDVVVGFTEDNIRPAVSTFTPNRSTTYRWRWEGRVTSCETLLRTQANLPLAAGDYEVVFVSHVHNNLARTAHWSLELDGYVLPTAADLAAFQEGSFNCEHMADWGAGEALTCNSNAVVGFEVDANAGTATIPYDPSLYTRDVDVTFASAPVPTTLGPQPPDQIFPLPESVYQAGSLLQCGDLYDFIDTSRIGLAGTWTAPATLPAPGDNLAPSLWIWSYGWESATVTVPHSPRLWLTQFKEAERSTEDEQFETATAYSGNEVVGWIDTETVQPSPVEVVAYDGPTSWPLTVTDAQWCDGYDPLESDNPDTDFGYTGLLADPVSATMNHGATHEDLTITFSSDPFQQ